MKTIVFGGTGDVGQIIVNRLIDQRKQVCVLTRQSKDSTDNLTYIVGNVIDSKTVQKCINEGDNVVIALGFNNSDLPPVQPPSKRGGRGNTSDFRRDPRGWPLRWRRARPDREPLSRAYGSCTTSG